MFTKILSQASRTGIRGSMLLLAMAAVSATALADPPGRVGRLNYISGSVSIRTGDTEEWGDATLNYPLTIGDHLWADEDSRAEIHIGSAALRLAPHTAFCLLNLDDQTAQIQLTEGSLNVHLRRLGDDDVFEIDTPQGAISLLREGDYRIDVTSGGTVSNVTVRHGEVEVTAEGSAFSVRPRQTAVITGGDSISYDILDAGALDGWDDWCATRDRRGERVAALSYVSEDTIGYEDLDEHGSWRTDASYGAVWVPRGIAVGWAPYREGRWCWREPWGWTWVDESPWGFAPFHYGRWAYVGGGWGWCPGTVVVGVRACYAPALVAFVGGGGFGASLSFGVGGGVGWFALGPREPWVPGYACSNTYIQNVNVTHVNITNVNITNIRTTNITYVNRSVPGACTAVSHTDFAGGRSVSRAAVVVPASAIGSAKFGATAAVAPTRQSVVASASVGASVKHPPAAAENRAIVAKSTPPPAPVPFAARQKALAANPGHPLDAAATASLRSSTKATVSSAPVIKSATVSSGKTITPARATIAAPHAATAGKTGGTAASGGGKNPAAGSTKSAGTSGAGTTKTGNKPADSSSKSSGTAEGASKPKKSSAPDAASKSAGSSGSAGGTKPGPGSSGATKPGATSGASSTKPGGTPAGSNSTKPGGTSSTKPDGSGRRANGNKAGETSGSSGSSKPSSSGASKTPSGGNQGGAKPPAGSSSAAPAKPSGPPPAASKPPAKSAPPAAAKPTPKPTPKKDEKEKKPEH